MSIEVFTPTPNPSYAQGFARSVGEAANPGLWDSLVGAWLPVLGPSGDDLLDISGLQNHGDRVIFQFTPSAKGYVLSGSSTASYVAIPDIGVLQNQDEFSVSATVYFSSLTADSDIFVIGAHAGGVPFLLWMDAAATDHFGFLMRDSGVKYSTFVPAIDTFYSIVFTYKGAGTGGEARLYINAKEDASSPFALTNSSMTGSNVYTIGNGSGGGKGLTGGITSVILHTRIISPQEIEQISSDYLALVRRRVGIAPFVAGAPPVGGHAGPLVNGPILKSKFMGLVA